MRSIHVATVWLLAIAGQTAATGAVELDQGDALEVAAVHVLRLGNGADAVQLDSRLPDGSRPAESPFEAVFGLASITNHLVLQGAGKRKSIFDQSSDQPQVETDRIRAWSTQVDAAFQINGKDLAQRVNKSDNARYVSQDTMHVGNDGNKLYDDGADGFVSKFLDWWR